MEVEVMFSSSRLVMLVVELVVELVEELVVVVMVITTEKATVMMSILEVMLVGQKWHYR